MNPGRRSAGICAGKRFICRSLNPLPPNHFSPLNFVIKYDYLSSCQPAGIGAPIHRFCHPFPGGSASLTIDSFLNRARCGRLALCACQPTQTARCAPNSIASVLGPCGSQSPDRSDLYSYKHTANTVIFRNERCNRKSGAV